MFDIQMRDQDDSISHMRDEIDNLQRSNRGLKESMTERDGQIRVTQMNLETSQKQNQLHAQEASVRCHSPISANCVL